MKSALSPREVQVVARMCMGERPKDIAVNLGLSVKTVSTYRARIMEKLAVNSNANIAFLIGHWSAIHGFKEHQMEEAVRSYCHRIALEAAREALENYQVNPLAAA